MNDAVQAKPLDLVPVEHIARAILVFRGHKVLLDAELAALYGVSTKRLNEQVKRNAERFPEDFLFRLSGTEVEALNRSQVATGSQKHRDPRFPPYAFTEHGAIMAATILNSPRPSVSSWKTNDYSLTGPIDRFAADPEEKPLRSQIATSNASAPQGRGGRRYLPYAFTEHGTIMAATIVNSARAMQMSVYVVRVFVKLRELLSSNRESARRFAQLKTRLDKKLTEHTCRCLGRRSGCSVFLDRELAAIYGVATGRLNEAAKRNIDRFPEDFMFQLARTEAELSRSQSVILNGAAARTSACR